MPSTLVKRRLVAACIAVGALAATTGCAPATASAASAPFRVTGYAEAGGTTTARIAASAKALTMVGVDGVNLTASADGISPVDPTALTLLRQAHKQGEKAELLFGNYSNDLGDFSDPLAETMFASPSKMDAVVTALKAEVATDGWDGITIDLESLNGFGADGHTRDDNAGLDSFVTRLRAALPSSSISICLVATTDSYADYGYDLTTIAASTDHVVLMAYDQHGPTWSDAGPVGGYPWAKSAVKLLAKGVAAAKIQLGIAGYGYSWTHGRMQSDGDQYTDKGARAKVKAEHATAHWDSVQKEWHATFKNGTVIWWSDAKSYTARKALAKSLHLGGVAVWSLSGADRLT
jgi:spore germination protein